MHGQGISKLGLLVTAVCADCHGAHGIYRAVDKRSTLYPTHVAATCGKCHRFIEERLEASVHGGGGRPGGEAKRSAPGGNGQSSRSPVAPPATRATICPTPSPLGFRQQLPNRCGNCHANLSSRYAMSIHGAVDRVGLRPGRQVLGLPRRARHPGRVQSAIRCSRRQNRAADVPQVPSARGGQFRRTSIRTPTTPTPERSPLVHARLRGRS